MKSMDEAQNLLDSREEVYGDRVSNMENVAKIFSGILGTEVRADQVPLLMIGYKTFRASQTPDYEDNIKDIEGYGLMFREVIGEMMIKAVNTDEYVAAKRARIMARREETPCKSCGALILPGAPAGDHTPACEVADLMCKNSAYNSTLEDEAAFTPIVVNVQDPVVTFTEPPARTTITTIHDLTVVQVEQMQREVPSYSPGPFKEGDPITHMEEYTKQLANIFQRAWRTSGPTVPNTRFSDAAAREAVEFFWLTFKQNLELQERIRELTK